MALNRVTKRIWMVESREHHFIIAAFSKEECKDLIDELAEEEVVEKFVYTKLGNICPTLPYYKNWTGESKIIISNF
jgi:hypothetical protein